MPWSPEINHNCKTATTSFFASEAAQNFANRHTAATRLIALSADFAEFDNNESSRFLDSTEQHNKNAADLIAFGEVCKRAHPILKAIVDKWLRDLMTGACPVHLTKNTLNWTRKTITILQ